MKEDLLLDNLHKLIEPIVTNLKYELYHLELTKEDGENYLRVYIDNENGISLKDCEKVSRPISDMLDEKDPIPYSYYLEVSSPGIYRTLFNDTHLTKSIGDFVLINLKSKFNGKKEFKGFLSSFDEKQIIITSNENEIIIPKEKINTINLADKEEGGNKK